MQQNRALAALEIYAIVNEIEKDITNAFVKKIYHLNGRIYLALHRGKDFTLVIAPNRLHFTNYKEKFPTEPSNFAMFLRKHLDSSILKEVRQHAFERIVEFRFARKDKEYFLITEFFGAGNVLLLNSERKIMGALELREWKDRVIKRDMEYVHPPASVNLKEISEGKIQEILHKEKGEVVRILARRFGLGGLYAEEVCARAGIDKRLDSGKVDSRKILSSIKEIFSELSELNKGFHYIKGSRTEISPIKLKVLGEVETKEFESFNAACDEFFISESMTEVNEREQNIRDKIERILDGQQRRLRDTLQEIGEFKIKAEQLSIEGQFKDASKHYEKLKKDKRKIEGMKKAIERTEKKLGSIKFEERLPVKKEKKEKQWFEKFRNFETTQGFVVVCGKDASTNDLLIKKYTSKEDIVFHADIQGAPFCVIKTEGRKVSENDLGEVAVISASYSKAWQRGLGVQDVYWVTPDQVSKKAPAGEFVATGAFMIYGKKNIIRKVPLKICIGIDKEGKVAAGAETFVKNKSIAYAVVVPGDDKSKEVAEKVKVVWYKKVSKETSEKARAIPLDDIQKYVPSGKGRVISGK